MEFSSSDVSRVDAAPDEIAANSVSEMYDELREFMRKYGRVDHNAEYQFLDRATGAKYHFDDSVLAQFFELLDACRRDTCILHVLERVGDAPAGIMVDFDHKQDAPAPSIFARDSISRAVALLAGIISEVLADPHQVSDMARISEEARRAICDGAGTSQGAPRAIARAYHIFAIKRDQITRDPSGDGYKDGIHLLVPEIWMSKGARRFVVARMRTRASEIFEDPLPNDVNTMVDMNSAHVSTHLLGSCKVGGIPYHLEYAARVMCGSGANTIVPLSMDALMSGYDRPAAEGGIKISLVYELSLTQYMPTFRGQPTWLQKRATILTSERSALVEVPFENIDIANLADTQRRGFEDQIAHLIGSDSEAAYLCDLLNALPISFAREYDQWLKVLMIIANENAKYKLLAQMFSMRAADKWNPTEFERIWSTLCIRARERGPQCASVTLHSLEFWVRAENPRAYEDAKSKSARGYLMASIFENKGKLDHDTIAGVLARILRGRYVIDTDAPDRRASDDWFEFVMADTTDIRPGEIYKWRRVRIPHSIYLIISTQIRAYCVAIQRDIYSRAEHSADEAHKEQYKRIAQKLGTQICSLRSNPFQEATIRQVKHMLYMRGFAASLDTQPFVIGVGNGVLEFINVEMPNAEPRLITGYHEIRVSNYTDVNYEPFDAANPCVRDIMRAYHDIFIEDDVCEFILFYLSTWLDLCDSQRTIILLGGGGSNGKTWSVLFPQAVLGMHYVRALKMQLLTEDHEKARETNSALMQLKGLRGGYFDESRQGEMLNPARVKSIVTPGFQSGRELYSSEEQFRNTANTIGISNYPIGVDATDNGTWDRILFYQCKARFTDNPDPANPYEHIKCKNMTEKWPRNENYRRAMLSILVHYRARLEREYEGSVRRIPCATIRAETNAFRAQQDPLARFIAECVVRSPRQSMPVHVLIDHYKHWYRETNGVRLTGANFEMLFQNSRVGEFIHPVADGGELIATGLRIRGKNDRLANDELAFD
jgi:phage/plasmid-associated DNA primase